MLCAQQEAGTCMGSHNARLIAVWAKKPFINNNKIQNKNKNYHITLKILSIAPYKTVFHEALV